MKKIYALFSSRMGDGSRCVYLSHASEEEINAFISINSRGFKDTYFFIGETEIREDDFIDADTREWYIPMWEQKVKCVLFPTFNN